MYELSICRSVLASRLMATIDRWPDSNPSNIESFNQNAPMCVSAQDNIVHD